MIKKYRKKPIVIEAIQYKMSDDDVSIEQVQDRIADFMEENIEIIGNKITIKTIEGEMIAKEGDYIIKGINGEFYPCKSAIFEKTYEVI